MEFWFDFFATNYNFKLVEDEKSGLDHQSFGLVGADKGTCRRSDLMNNKFCCSGNTENSLVLD